MKTKNTLRFAILLTGLFLFNSCFKKQQYYECANGDCIESSTGTYDKLSECNDNCSSYYSSGTTGSTGSTGTTGSTGSGIGSIVFYVGCGTIAPVGQSLADCGSYKIVLRKSSGGIIGVEQAFEIYCRSEVFCGAYGAASFEDIPAGEYIKEKWCNDTNTKIGEGTYIVNEDKCRKQTT